MPAAHASEITHAMIVSRLAQVAGATVAWTGTLPRDCASYESRADWAASYLVSGEVLEAIDRHDLHGDDALGEIDMAISLASEPSGLPDNGIVEVYFDE